MKITKNLKSDFDEFLKDEGIFEEVSANAIKKVIAYQIAEEMKAQNITKSKLAKLMNTSRVAIDRLLSPDNSSLTLSTLISATNALGKRLDISLI